MNARPSAIIFGLLLLLTAFARGPAAQTAAPPSARCHVTDGAFTVCSDGTQEWSDVPAQTFPETAAALYADQADLDPSRRTPGSAADTFMLLYDECRRTTPLAPNEYFLVSFDTVEIEDGREHLERYVIHLFTDGTLIFFENGVMQPPGRAVEVEGMRGSVGFGPSPGCPVDHAIAEFQIELDAAGGHSYSPDPIFWGASPPPPPPCPANQSTTIPVVINVLNNAGISAANARAAVRAASQVLGNANQHMRVRLNVVATHTGVSAGDDGSGGGTAGDGDLTADERRKVRAAGGQEIGNLSGGKGLKVTFARTPIAGRPVPGVAVHRDPTVIVTRRATDSIAQAGIVIAHEMAHVLTLAGHSSDAGNLMNPQEPPQNTQLTDDQAREICTNGLSNHGVSVTTRSPGQKVPHQYGATTDDVDDGVTGIPHLDLYRLMLNSEAGAPAINGLLALGGTFPVAGVTAAATYRLVFDADGNAATGVAVGPFAGIDRELRLQVAPGSGTPPSATGIILDHTGGRAPIALPTSPEVFVEGSADTDDERHQAQIGFVLPRALLELSAVDVPVGVVSQEGAGGIEDSMALVFDQNASDDAPSLVLPRERAAVGSSLPFEIHGLLPGSAFELLLDDTVLVTGTLDATGSFTGVIEVPAVAPDTYFLTAQDASGGFAFNIIEVIPAPLASGNIINNGLVQLGINNEGHLNVPGGTPSSGTGTTVVGLRYVPADAEATAPGCLCEGWGAADAITGVRGYANQAVDGVVNLVPVSFTSTGASAVSVVQVGSTFRVTHDYHPSASPNLYEVTVTIENIGGADADVRYRRVMDWDVEPTAFREFVTLLTGPAGGATRVLFSSDNGFASANPLVPGGSILFTGEAVDSGPADHGALFDFGFPTLPADASLSFNIYYGAAGSEAEALAALATVRAEAFSLGQPSTVNGPTLGTPNTFVFGFSKIGGAPVVPADGDGDSVLDEIDNCPASENEDQRDGNLNGIGDACERPGLIQSTAAFLQARLDGTTAGEPRSLLVADDPSLLERLVRIVEFRIEAGLAVSAADLTANLVSSLVEAGLVAPGEDAALREAVLAQINQAPDCSALTASPAQLWPPNHAMVRVTVGGATDPDPGDSVASTVTGVTQDEAVNGLGDGDTAPDAQVTALPSPVVFLRAERGGKGDGRVYRVNVTGTDAHGATCQGTVLVGVPHDKGRSAIDSGLVFDSLRRP